MKPTHRFRATKNGRLVATAAFDRSKDRPLNEEINYIAWTRAHADCEVTASEIVRTGVVTSGKIVIVGQLNGPFFSGGGVGGGKYA